MAKTYAEYLANRKKNNPGSNATSNSGATSSYRDYLKRRDATTDQLSKDVTELNSAIESMMNGWQDPYTMAQNKNKLSSMVSRLSSTKDYVNNNADSYVDASAYLKSLDEYSSYYSKVLETFDEYAKEYKKYKNADDYSEALEKYKANVKEREEALALDLGTAEAEIKELEDLNKRASGSAKSYNEAYGAYKRGGLSDADAERLAKMAVANKGATPGELLKESGYGSIAELQDAITKKKVKFNTAKRLQGNKALVDNAVNSTDFEFYAQKGADIKNPTVKEAEGWLTIGNYHVGGTEVGNIVTYSRDKDKEIGVGGGNDVTMVGKSKYSLMKDDEVKVYNYYLAKEKDGLIEKGTAQKYLDSLEDTLNQREASEYYDKMLEGNTGLELVFGVTAGLDQFGSGMRNLFNTEDDYIAPSAVQYASSMAREDLGNSDFSILGQSIPQAGYDLITTTTNMMPSILTSTIVSAIATPLAGQMVGASLIGASASGNAYQEMLNLGYDKDQARVYSALTGVSEAALEYALGGITKLSSGAFSKLSKKSVEAIAKGINNASAQFAIKYGTEFLKEMGSEGFEEFLQDILDPFFQTISTGEKLNIPEDYLENAIYSGVLGALSAGILNGVDVISNRSAEINTARGIQKEGKVGDLKQVANTFAADTLAYKIADKVTDKTGAYKLSQLLHEVNANLTEQNQATIKNELVKNGMTDSDAESITKWLSKAVSGGYFTKLQQEMLDENPIISKVFKDVIIDSNSTVNQRLQWVENTYGSGRTVGFDYAELAERMKLGNLSKRVNETRNTLNDLGVDYETYTSSKSKDQAKVGEAYSNYVLRKSLPKNDLTSRTTDSAIDSMVAEGVAQARANIVSKANRIDSLKGNLDEKVSTEEGHDAKKISSFSNGKMMVELDDGTVADSENVVFKSEDQAYIILSIAQMANRLDDLGINLDTDSANAVLNGYVSYSGVSVSDYIMAAEEGIRYGVIGQDIKKISKSGFFVDLTESQQNYLYKIGRDISEAITREAESNRITPVSRHEKANGRGKVVKKFKSKPSKKQRVVLEMVEKLSQNGVLKNNFYFYESEQGTVTINGEIVNAMVFSNDVGIYKKGDYAPNGFYENESGDVYIDINSGSSGQGLAIYTLAHELGHFVEKTNPTGFKVLSDYISKELGSELEVLIGEKLNLWRQLGRTNLKYMDAYKDVICDSLEPMFTDGNLAEKLVEYSGSSIGGKGLIEALKQFFENLYKRIQSAFAKLPPEDPAAVEMKKLQNAVEEASNLFAKALVEATNRLQVTGEIDIDGNETSHEMSLRSIIEGTSLYFDFNDETGEYRVLDRKGGKEVTSVTAEQVKNSPLGNLVNIALRNSYITEREAKKQYGFLADLVNLCLDYKDNFTMIWEIAGTQVFSAIKANSDVQYGKTIDFSTVCKKTQQVINVISETQKRLKRGLTKDEIMNVVYYETGKAGEPTPCPVCYVFSRWMGIGGILQQMYDYQKKYEGLTEAEMRSFINDIEVEVVKHANTPTKSGKLKADFFDKNGKVKFGKVIADLKSKAQSKINSANKAIKTNAENKLKLQELETLLETASEKESKTLLKKIESLRKKIKDDAMLESNLNNAEATMRKFEEYQWLTKTYMDEVVAEDGSHLGWKKDPNFKPVDDDTLFDLRQGAAFATKYPKSWKYRTTKGCNAGKAILPYSDARVGETIQGVAYSNVKDIKVGETNAFLNGDEKAQLDYINRAIKKQSAQNLIGGMRYQSTSDFRYEYGSDYLITFLEMQAIGAKVQLYTKVIEAVDFLCTVGAEVNLSVMPLNDGYKTLEDGRKQLVFSSVTGINAEAAIAKSREYDNAQLILVGISDEHIRLALEGDDVNGDIVTFVIPFHGSGNTIKTIQDLMNLLGQNLDVTKAQDYSLVQSDHFAKNRTAEQKALWDLRKKIISRTYSKNGKQASWDGVLSTSEEALLNKPNSKYVKDLYNRFYVDRNAEEYGVALSTAQAEQIFPYEYWDKSLTYDEADQNGERFKEYCATMGIVPRFSGMDSSGKKLGYGDFTNDKGYWKLLIDRKMYNNDGTYHYQEKINVTNFETKTLDPAWGSVTYGDVMQSDTDPKKTNAITENVIRQLNKGSVAEADNGVGQYEFSLRMTAPPKETKKAYKLMRLVDGKLYPLFIGNNEEIAVGTWYNADSPNLSQLKSLPEGTHLIDMTTGEAISWDEYAEENVPKRKGKFVRSKPNVDDIHWANDNGYRFIHIVDKADQKASANRMLKQYGDTRAYYNWGVNGSSKTESGEGSASLYALRPGWHFGEVPSMHQIGYPTEDGENARLDNQVWVEVEMSADIDYNAEAESNWGGDIPTHIPTDGYYRYATNPTQKKTKSGNTKADNEKADWYVAGAFKVNRIMSDTEADSIVENYNKKNGTNVPLDYRRANNRVFNADTMSLEDTPSVSFSDRNIFLNNRNLLANALETSAQNDAEKRLIARYQADIKTINEHQQRLSEIHSKLFTKGITGDERKKLQKEASETSNRIQTLDKRLLRLEAMQPVKEIINRERTLAKKKAAKEGREALSKLREKSAQTQKELMNRFQERIKRDSANRNRTELRHKILKKVKELNDLLLKGDKEHHVPLALQKSTAMALSAINLDTVNAEQRLAKIREAISKAKDPDKIRKLQETYERIALQGERMMAKLDALDRAYSDIKNSNDPLMANVYDESIKQAIVNLKETVGDTPLREMSLSQLESVYDMYKLVLHTIRTANSTFKLNKKETITELGERVMEQIRATGGSKKFSPTALKFFKKFMWSNLKPIYAMKVIGSETLSELFNNIRAGEDTWARDVNEAREFFLDMVNKYHYADWDFAQRYTFESKVGKEFSLSLQDIMSLYAYSKRDQADLHLSMGGFVFEDAEIIEKVKGIPVKYDVNIADAYNISIDTLGNIINTLTPEQLAFVNEMQKYLSDMGNKGNEVTRVMYDIDLFKEKNYFPLKSAKQFMFEQNEVAGEVRIKNSGFTKSTVPKANNPIILRGFMDVWAEHINEMSMYHAFVLPLEDFNRVFNYKTPSAENTETMSVKQTIQNAYGKQANDYVKQMLTDLNGGARSQQGAEFTNKLISLFKKGSVFASASVVVQQPSAIARAMAYIDGKYFTSSALSSLNLKNLSSEWEEVKKYAPVAIIKEMGYFDTNVGKQTTEWITSLEYKGFGEKLKALITDSSYRDEVLAKAPALADEFGWVYIWNAVKAEMADTNKELIVGSENFLEACGKRFTEVVINTQVYDSVLSRSALMRSKDTGVKMATSFMAEATTSLNMIAVSLLQAKREGKSGIKQARKTIGAVIASMILNSILVSFVYAARDDDDEKTYVEKYIGTLAGTTLDALNPLSLVPYVKDVVSIVQGYDVERSDMSVISDLYKGWQNLFKDSVTPYRKVEGFAGSIANLFGIPLKNIMRDARGMYNVVSSILDDNTTTTDGIRISVVEQITGDNAKKQMMNSLINAMESGDTNQIKSATQDILDSGREKSSIQSALTNYWKPLFLDAYRKGDNNKMAQIRKALHATGIYKDAIETTQNWIKSSKE